MATKNYRYFIGTEELTKEEFIDRVAEDYEYEFIPCCDIGIALADYDQAKKTIASLERSADKDGSIISTYIGLPSLRVERK